MSDIKKLEQDLGNLHQGLIDELRDRITKKTATSADLALAWKILQDNGVPLANLRKGVSGDEEAGDLLGSLPFPGSQATG